jgi:hypothetical protein
MLYAEDDFNVDDVLGVDRKKSSISLRQTQKLGAQMEKMDSFLNVSRADGRNSVRGISH